MDALACIVGLILFAVLVLFLLVLFFALFSKPSDEERRIANQINSIGTEAKAEMDQISAEYLRKAYKPVKKGSKNHV